MDAPEMPYGSWPTPVTSELVVRSKRTPTGVALDGGDVWWSESRPEEGGRNVVRRQWADGTVTDVLAAPWNARSAVHEYGGGAWWVSGDVLWFTDWASQRVHRVDTSTTTTGTEPVALTPQPAVGRGLRYADGDVSPDGTTILCVREQHGEGEVVNTIVRFAAAVPSVPEVVVDGPDFVSDPRWSPDGSSWCWLEWDHPDMPWDATRLVVGTGRSRVVAAGADTRESVGQPTWAPDGSLWFVSDRSGFGSLHRWTSGGGREVVVDVGEDIGSPQWTFGESCFAVLDGGLVAFRSTRDGLDRLAVRRPDGGVVDADLPYTSMTQLRADGTRLAFVAASPTTEPHVVHVTVDRSGRVGAPVIVMAPRDLGIDAPWFSRPEPIDFPTGDGDVAHAVYYAPANPEVRAPAGERPPLIVVIHGGPTSAARVLLNLSYQYWTTRGIAVVDVNYRGSSGYGRAYREKLAGAWGVADVEDCAAVCRFLVDRGDVDPERLCIRGGSAGGFTALAALAFQDVFSAGASLYGVADLAALARDTHKFESRYLDGLVGPWPAARAVYEARSPIFHVDRIDRPLVVFQGLEDEVVPPNQSEMIVEAVRAKGVPVAYVAFPGEQHGFRQAATIRAALDGELSFYAQVLGFSLPGSEDITRLPVDNL
ncbi:MAG: S9 family peptidase [Ilumatobacteraceae bacterium]